jgi:hypothetical protein
MKISDLQVERQYLAKSFFEMLLLEVGYGNEAKRLGAAKLKFDYPSYSL